MKKKLSILDDGWKRQRALTIFPGHTVLTQGKNAFELSIGLERSSPQGVFPAMVGSSNTHLSGIRCGGRKQLNHGFTHCLSNIHVGFGVTPIVAAGTATFGEGMRVDSRYVVFEFRIFP